MALILGLLLDPPCDQNKGTENRLEQMMFNVLNSNFFSLSARICQYYDKHKYKHTYQNIRC